MILFFIIALVAYNLGVKKGTKEMKEKVKEFIRQGDNVEKIAIRLR